MTTEKQEIPVVYNIADAGISEIAAKYKAADANTKDGYLAVKTGIAECRSLRSRIEDTRKTLKQASLEYGRRVDAEAKRLTSLVEAIEEPLKKQKQLVDDAEQERKLAAERAEREERERKERERIAEDEKRLEAEREKLKQEREAFERQQAELQAKLTEQRKKEEAEQAERERIEREQAEAEKAKADADRLAIEEERRKINEERAKIERERQEIERERERQAEQQRLAREAEELAEQERKEKERQEQERLQAIEEEKKRRKELAERIDSLSGDFAELRRFSNGVMGVLTPEVKDLELRMMIEDSVEAIVKAATCIGLIEPNMRKEISDDDDSRTARPTGGARSRKAKG